MINDQYFPLEANLTDDDRLCRLLEENGMEGLGIYVILLTELRRRNGYRCNMQSLPRIARNMRISTRKLKSIIHSYNLFHLEGDQETGILSSPYLDRVMAKLDEKREKKRVAGIARASNAPRSAGGQFASTGQPVKESIVKESTSSSSEEEEPVAAVAIQPWEFYMDQAMQEQSWVELCGKSSGLGMDFIDNLPFIFICFKEHILTQGTEGSILSLRDAKSYFNNFIRDGSCTNKRVRERLEKERMHGARDDPYRFETVDPETGERSYCGISIPADAPPRPNGNAMWNPVDNSWSG